MRANAVSLRQVIVLTATGLMAPAVELLPKALADRAGSGAWLTPLLMLPVLVVWTFLLGSLFKKEGSGLFSVLKQRLGRGLGWLLTLLYIMWGGWLLSEQVERSAERMGAVYGGSAGGWIALLVLALAVWMAWKRENGLYRAAELFWLAMAVAVIVYLVLSLPQVEGGYLLPAEGWWKGQAGSSLFYIDVWATAVFSSALLTKLPRRAGAVRQAALWMAVSCLAAAGILAGILGQMGAGLTGKLEHPFLITVQGLSLEGAIGRLEAPVAALWLMADFCRMSLFLLSAREAGRQWGGRWLLVAGGVLAFIAQRSGAGAGGAALGGMFLGTAVPVCLWILSFLGGKKRGKATSCGK